MQTGPKLSIVVIQNFLLPYLFLKTFQGGVPFTLIFNKNLPYDVESAIARFGNHGAVPLIKLNELNMRGRVPGEFLYFLIKAGFHISNRPWIPCDAYTK